MHYDTLHAVAGQIKVSAVAVDLDRAAICAVLPGGIRL